MKIASSLLSSDFSKLREEIEKLEKAGVDLIHLDVMDGHFVPNITFGPQLIKSIRSCTDLPFDVHLMIEHPQKFIKEFAKAGADILTFHYESADDVRDTIRKINLLGKKVGVSIKPKTRVEEIFPYLDDLDLVLVMTVEPGFGGQEFLFSMVEKIKRLKEEIVSRKLPVLIEVDGGINSSTAKIAKEAGVDICVAGTSIFSYKNYTKSIKLLKFKGE